jgi:hypothetical protein
MRRQPGAASGSWQRLDLARRFVEDKSGFNPALDPGHLKKGKDPQRSGHPHFRQQFGHRFDVGDGGRACAQEHLRASQP